MTVIVVSMLRAVNLGPRNRIKMEALRALYESLELEQPQTYVQSGNVVFKARERNLVRLASKIESGIERSFGFHSDVILRTCSELRSVVARNPFAARDGIDPSKLLVHFLARDPGPEARDIVLKINAD
jgi:uncharacterized protein (DUF1697 family)